MESDLNCLRILSALCSGTVLDSVKVSDSEEVSDQDTGSNVVEREESFVLYFENVYT